MRITPSEIMSIPVKIIEFEIGMIDKARRAAATAIYQTFSSSYIAEKRIAESEIRKEEDRQLEVRIDAILPHALGQKEEVLDLTDDEVIDLRAMEAQYSDEPAIGQPDADLSSSTKHR